MKKILGIDTGGTYTDGVVIEADSKQILVKTKTLTTRRSLPVCIKNCIAAFSPEELEGISLVCLSTTLATNAIVEGRGCREGLMLIGGRPEGKMPTERYRIVQGRPDIMGRMRERIDPQEVDEAIESFRGTVDALAVSGYASVRNPAHEIYVKERIREKLGIPVVCAHELTTSLGFYDRTVTADLNAKLIPVICGLIDSVKDAMQTYQINAPLMLVKGDGTLMTEACARDKPIETILSGPAASVKGGVFLSGETDAVILDMGGTTTDLANITDGKMRMNNEGANVGGWFTRIRAAEIYTVGLGGDSRIYLDSTRNVCIGPQKVIPYCMAGAWFPRLQHELQAICEAECKPLLHFWRNEGEAYMIVHYSDFSGHTPEEKQVLDAIYAEPHTLYTLQHTCGLTSPHSVLEKLIAEDVVGRIALTPTDILHTTGGYVRWNAEISRLAVDMAAGQLGLSFEDCIDCLQKSIHQQVSRACIRGSFSYDNTALQENAGEAADYFIRHIFLNDGSGVLGGTFFLKKPIVAIGAPARAWVEGLSQTLRTRVTIPEHAEVANAVGAAVGQAMEQADLLIRFDQTAKTYTLFSAKSRLSFAALEEATEAASALGRQLATANLPGEAFDVTCHIDDTYVQDRFSGEKRFVERHVCATAVSRPAED